MNSLNHSAGTPRSLGARTLAVTAISAATSLASLGFYAAAARKTDVGAFGSSMQTLTLVWAAAGFVDFGSNLLWTRELAAGRRSRWQWAEWFLAKRRVALLIFAGLVSIGIGLHESSVVASGPLIFMNIMTAAIQVPIRADGRVATAQMIALVERICGVALIVLTPVSFAGSPLLGAALLSGCVALAVSAMALGPGRLARNGNTARIWNPWCGTAQLGLSGLLPGVQGLDLNVLGALSGPSSAGAYAAVTRWTNPMGMTASAFSQSALPTFAASDGSRRVLLHAMRAGWLIYVGVACCLAVFCLSPLIVAGLLGNQYGESASVLRLLALATIPSLFTQPCATFLQATRRSGIALISLTAGAAAQFLTLILLAPTLGALGAACGFLVGQTVSLVLLGKAVWAAA